MPKNILDKSLLREINIGTYIGRDKNKIKGNVSKKIMIFSR
jgi:hypothetical protein